jgi:GAF domain-containing protein
VTEIRAQRELGPLFTPLAAALRDGRSAEEIYQAIVEAAVRVIDGCDHASVTLKEGAKFRTAASSDDVARQMDVFERETHSGPCVDAIEQEGFQHDLDLTVDPTWPELAKKALSETPVRSMLGFRLIHDGRKAGALDLFSDTIGGLAGHSVDEASVLAAFATIALAGVQQRDRADNLALALDSNREIGKAVGLLMASHKLTDEQAFNVLKKTSQDMNRKLAEIAVEYVARESAASATPS